MIGATLIIALLAANAFFVGAEFAFVMARRAKMEQLAARGNRTAKIASAATKELSLMLAGAQLGITMTSIGLGYFAEPAVASLIERALTPYVTLPANVLHTISFVLALSVVLYFHLVVGEHIPKNIAIAHPDASLLWIARPFNLYARLFRPFIRLLNGMANAGLRLVGVEPKDELFSAASPSDLSAILRMLKKEGVIEDVRHRLLSGTLTFNSLDAESIMVPRTRITAISHQASAAEIEDRLRETGLTRLPLFDGDLDHMVGFVHGKDLLRVPQNRRHLPPHRSLVKELLLVPASRKLGDLLGDMRTSRRHLAVVIDEHGGTAGIVTLEDILVEIVGETGDLKTGAQTVRQMGPGHFVVPGDLRRDEVRAAIGLNLPEGDYETLAGFMMVHLGRLPVTGDEVSLGAATFRIKRIRSRQVDLVEVLLSTEHPTGSDLEEPSKHQH